MGERTKEVDGKEETVEAVWTKVPETNREHAEAVVRGLCSAARSTAVLAFRGACAAYSFVKRAMRKEVVRDGNVGDAGVREGA